MVVLDERREVSYGIIDQSFLLWSVALKVDFVESWLYKALDPAAAAGALTAVRRCHVSSPTRESGGTLSVVQRDSSVSGYNPCAEQPPAQSASLWSTNSTQGSGGIIFILCFSVPLFLPGQDTQPRSLLDERELGTSLGAAASFWLQRVPRRGGKERQGKEQDEKGDEQEDEQEEEEACSNALEMIQSLDPRTARKALLVFSHRTRRCLVVCLSNALGP
ncbi:hypothetical protein EYF80_000898 [Liparis tanakae]|uniref:Uncharacterized protein n=1 Tax=Liparis tanakae TaxID=230148 RepID=A0A4Z2JFS2_9TELE|nr:hypothetical protein EYF80_000898 [Liparis tanakae]